MSSTLKPPPGEIGAPPARESARARRHRWTARARSNWSSKVVLTLCAVALVAIVVYPLVMLFVGSFTLGFVDVGPENYTRVFIDPRLYSALRNTLWIAIGSTAFSIACGVPIAWVVTRTNVRGRGLLKFLVGVAFMTPAYQGAVSYIMLLGPHSGYVNRWYMSLFGTTEGLFDIYGMWGIILVTTINTFPYVVFLCGAALASVDVRLEDSARILGASRFRVLSGITWKLVTPAVLASALLVFVHSMSLFGAHAFLGMPRGVFTLPTRIFELFLQFPPDYAGAASLSMILVVTTAVLLFWQRRFLSKRSYVTVAGKTARPATTELGRLGKWICTFGCHAFFTLAVYLPVGVLVWVSFSESRVTASLDTLTWTNYSEVLFDVGLTKRGLKNSLMLGFGAATVGTLMAGLVAYMTLRLQTRAVRLLDYLAMVPLGIPGVALGVGLILAWINVPVPIYGTTLILLVAYVARTMPLGVRAADSSIRQIEPALENAARVSGATRLRSMFDVTLPLMKGGLLAAWALIFMTSIQELGATILLFTPGNETVAVAIFDRASDGRMEHVAALAVITMVITLAVLWVINRLSGGSVAARIRIR